VEQSKEDGVTEGNENRHPHELQKGTNTYSVKKCNFLKHRLIVFHQIIYFSFNLSKADESLSYSHVMSFLLQIYDDVRLC
jgi:hypothetical protein